MSKNNSPKFEPKSFVSSEPKKDAPALPEVLAAETPPVVFKAEPVETPLQQNAHKYAQIVNALAEKEKELESARSVSERLTKEVALLKADIITAQDALLRMAASYHV